jgi:restriction endonuclease S subunit
MQKKLSEIAKIVSGYTFRTSIENDPKGKTFVLQAKNIGANLDIVDTSDFDKISDKSMRDPYFLEYNDVLLISRGSGLGSFKSALFATDQNNVIPSSSVHVIRVTDVTVLPKYVSLYFNSIIGQRGLFQIITGGSALQSILVKNLMDFKIPIPIVHTQKTIIALHENIYEQEKILKRKKELQKSISNAIFSNLTREQDEK